MALSAASSSTSRCLERCVLSQQQRLLRTRGTRPGCGQHSFSSGPQRISHQLRLFRKQSRCGSLPETHTEAELQRESSSHASEARTGVSEARSGVSEAGSGEGEPDRGRPKGKEALSALDAYFDMLNPPKPAESEVTPPPPVAGAPTEKESDESGVRQESVPKSTYASKAGTTPKSKDKEALNALDAYFNILNPPKPPEPEVKPPPPVSTAPTTEKKPEDVGFRQEVIDAWKKTFEDEGEQYNQQEMMEAAQKALETVIQTELSPWNRFLDRQLPANGVNALAAISVAVYLFELASPQTVPGNFATSLPNLFGAKVNELIAMGEWWRLFTPSLLHAGFFHIGLSVWALLTFGPQIEAAYGTTTFIVLFFLTGAFGNLMSFAQTQDPTIGGTGPIYGMVGAWLIFLIKNREVIGKEKADNMTRQAIFLSALNVALGNPLPIDDWTHIGAALGGLLFGAFAAPKLTKKPKDKAQANEDQPLDEFTRSLSEHIFGVPLDYKAAQKDIDFVLEREALDYRKLGFAVVVSVSVLVALLEVGLSGDVNVLPVLPSLLGSDSNIDFI